jgi:hypothetical protein
MSEKMHPIEKTIRPFPDLSEWYSGSALIKNTAYAGGGIEKATIVGDLDLRKDKMA